MFYACVHILNIFYAKILPERLKKIEKFRPFLVGFIYTKIRIYFNIEKKKQDYIN